MTGSDPTFRRLFRAFERASQSARPAAAVRLLEADASWQAWMEQLTPIYLSEPERELELGRTLREAAEAANRPLEAARFSVVVARSLQRTGSPAAAAAAFLRAATALDAHGDDELAVKARVLRVDALAHAGRLDDARAAASEARLRLRGAAWRVWRAVVDVNEANALRLAGRVDAATRLYERAARRFRDLGSEHSFHLTRTNAAVARLDAGDGPGARRRLEEASAYFRAAHEDDLLLDAQENLACAHVLEGHLGEAITLFETLVTEHETRGLTRRAAGCRMDLADALRRAGDRRAAEREALLAAATFQSDGAQAERVEALWLAAQACDDTRRAAEYLRDARRAAERVGRAGIAARCMLLEQDVGLRSGRRPDPAVLARIDRTAQERGDRQLAAESALLRAHGLVAAERYADATAVLSQPALRRPGRPWLRAAADACRARCEAAAGDAGGAIRRLRRVAGFLDAVRGGLPGPWLRTTFVLETLDPHLLRVQLLLERGRMQDRREAAALLDALAARRFLERGRPARLVDEATRRRLEALYDQLARGDGTTRGLEGERKEALEREARRLERRVADAWRARERRGARRSGISLARPRVARLARNAVAVHVWKHDGQVQALLRRGDDVSPPARLGSVADVAARVDRMLFHADRVRLFGLDTSPAPLLAELEGLAEQLLAPLAPAGWPQRVHVVAGAGLPAIPWELLPVAGTPLCRRHAFLRTPALAVRRARPAPAAGETLLAVGEADLPAIEREMASAGRGRRRVERRRATRDALAGALAACRMVHVAGHGLAAPEAPPLGGIRLHDGWFGAADVPPRVGAELVVLSACRTGIENTTAAVAWGGLPTALLAAGSRWVLWTADDVDDDTASRVAAAFHAARATAPPPVAFGHAIATIWEQDGHPARLMPFRLTGVAG